MKAHFLDPQTLSRIDNYPLLARTVVEGFVSGLHRSLYHGFGSEFVQYRNYSAGDDLKFVDWKVFARLDKVQVKVFQEETNTNCYIVLDTSASMAYAGSQRELSKLGYGKMVAACLAHLVLRQGDNAGFYAYDTVLRAGVRPGHRGGQLEGICATLHRLESGGTCDHRKVLNYLAETFNRRGIVVFISDFLDADEAFFNALRGLRLAHHDCVCIQLLDDDELDLPFSNTVRFVDSETGEELVTAPAAVRERYRRRIDAFLSELEGVCARGDLDYLRMRTSQPLANALAAYLHRRETLR